MSTDPEHCLKPCTLFPAYFGCYSSSTLITGKPPRAQTQLSDFIADNKPASLKDGAFRFSDVQRAAMMALGKFSGWSASNLSRNIKAAFNTRHDLHGVRSAPAATQPRILQHGRHHPFGEAGVDMRNAAVAMLNCMRAAAASAATHALVCAQGRLHSFPGDQKLRAVQRLHGARSYAPRACTPHPEALGVSARAQRQLSDFIARHKPASRKGEAVGFSDAQRAETTALGESCDWSAGNLAARGEGRLLHAA